MIRPGAALCGRFLLSAAVSLALVSFASAQSSDAPAAETPATDASAGEAADASSAQPEKNLETVPADGLGDTAWLSGATRIVREITLRRPHEDLVICIAGCPEKQDRVVFAQPAEIVSKKPGETMSDAGPTAASAPAVIPAASPAASQPALSPVPAVSAQDAKPFISKSATAAAAIDLRKSEFEPSMSQAPSAPAAALPEASPAAK